MFEGHSEASEERCVRAKTTLTLIEIIHSRVLAVHGYRYGRSLSSLLHRLNLAQGQYFIRFSPLPPDPEDPAPQAPYVVRELNLEERAVRISALHFCVACGAR